MTNNRNSRADALTIRDLILNDAYAMSFQTMGQYRTALLAALNASAGDGTAYQRCACGTALAHTHHRCTAPVMWRMYEQPDALASVTPAARDVLGERRRQIEHEGATSEQDDLYTEAELPRAAAAYALSASCFSNAIALDFWPFSTDWWKPTTPRRNLVKAAALILAEIERIDRVTAACGEKSA